MDIIIQGQTLTLLPQRAVFWKEKKALILSDIHIGKAASMQKAGIPVPEGAMEEDLQSLSKLAHNLGAAQCIIVGDLIHNVMGLTEKVVDLFSTWLKEAACTVDLVLGNHDRALIKKLPDAWPLNIHKEHFYQAPFCFCHSPFTEPEYFVWAGHIHPKIRLATRYDSLVLRCFQIYPNLGILPAFSRFVGGSFVYKENGCRIFVTTEKEVFEV